MKRKAPGDSAAVALEVTVNHDQGKAPRGLQRFDEEDTSPFATNIADLTSLGSPEHDGNAAVGRLWQIVPWIQAGRPAASGLTEH